MMTINYLFLHVIILSNLLAVIKPQPGVPNGCVGSGLTDCCTLDTCVTLQGCYCDQGCYDTSDCCEDIHLTCPRLDGSHLDGGSGDSPTTEPSFTRPPIITIAPEENVTVPTAQPHRLTVIIGYDRGFPLSTLTWRKDGEIITSRTNPRVSVMSNGGISIGSVKSSDRGLYTITVSNTVGSDSASFKLYTKFANLIQSGFRGRSFYCEANGYPTANFIGWTAMNGSSVTNYDWTSFHSVTSEYESTMSASIPLDAVNCTVGGISCVFDNGNGDYQVQSPMMDCPTVIEIGFEEKEYTISEQAASNQYVALKVCLKQTNAEGFASNAESFMVTIATQGGTAIMGDDFVGISSNRTFSLPLQRFEVCECLSIIQDDVIEGDEVFYISLTSTHPRVVTTGAVVHIIDDDVVTASLERAEYFASESDGCVEVCVVLVGRYQRSVTVYLCVEGISATAGEDYIGRTKALPLSFQTSALISPETRGKACGSVMLINDNITEGNETFRVTLQENPDDSSVVLGDQASAIVTIIDDDKRPLTATFINNTPRVEGNTITINFFLDGGNTLQINSLKCKIKGPGKTPALIIQNCSSGVVVAELPPRRQEYIFTLEYTVGGSDGQGVLLLERDFRLDSDVCWLHLVNEGIVVNGSSATIEWQPSGPFAVYKSSSFQCMKDFIREKENCSSPYTWSDLSLGEHRLIIEPYQTPGCRRLLTRAIDFTIY